MYDATYEQAFSDTYRKFSGPLNRFLYSMVRDSHFADDILHDLFLRLYEKGVLLDPESNTTFGFLCEAAKNTAIDHIRKQTRYDELNKSLVLEEVSLNKKFYSDIENSYIEGEVISTISDAINTFPEHERAVYISRIFKNSSIARASTENRMSQHRVRKIVKKINMNVRQDLVRFFPDDDFMTG